MSSPVTYTLCCKAYSRSSLHGNHFYTDQVVSVVLAIDVRCLQEHLKVVYRHGTHQRYPLKALSSDPQRPTPL